MATVNLGSGGPLDHRIELREINEMITCKICQGYLIDATTVTECLHTFCKSCIVKHLEDSNTCPECEDLIHQSHPLDYIAFDRTMQDLVYKIVPNLEKDEFNRERAFYSERGLPCPKDQEKEDSGEDANGDIKKAAIKKEEEEAEANADYHRFDEQVNLLLECNMSSTASTSASSPTHPSSASFRNLKRKFIRCSSLATVTHLKKFIAKKLLNSIDKYKDVDITCNDEPLYKDHTLKFVYVTRWRTKEPPMKLQFIPKKEAEA